MTLKWQTLLAQLELLESPAGREIWTEEQLLVFESKNGIILPDDYKIFCTIFGAGMLGDYIRIRCPHMELQFGIEALKIEVNDFYNLNSDSIELESMNKLLCHAFVFGDTGDAEIVFWDLRTYTDLDKNYDIYLAKAKYFDGNIYRVGRDFFKFVCEFCLGTKSYDILPECMQPHPQQLHYTFTRFCDQFS